MYYKQLYQQAEFQGQGQITKKKNLIWILCMSTKRRKNIHQTDKNIVMQKAFSSRDKVKEET